MKSTVQFEMIWVAVFLFAINASADITRVKGDFRDGKVSVDLVSEVKSIRAGEPFTIGVRIIHAPGWHTYWKSPGVAGVPTVLDWDMPEGFKADSFQWPAPQSSIMAGRGRPERKAVKAWRICAGIWRDSRSFCANLVVAA